MVAASYEAAAMRSLMNRDWTRLLPRKEGTTDQERVVYLVEFIMRQRASRIAQDKAVKELTKLSRGD